MLCDSVSRCLHCDLTSLRCEQTGCRSQRFGPVSTTKNFTSHQICSSIPFFPHLPLSLIVHILFTATFIIVWYTSIATPATLIVVQHIIFHFLLPLIFSWVYISFTSSPRTSPQAVHGHFPRQHQLFLPSVQVLSWEAAASMFLPVTPSITCPASIQNQFHSAGWLNPKSQGQWVRRHFEPAVTSLHVASLSHTHTHACTHSRVILCYIALTE